MDLTTVRLTTNIDCCKIFMQRNSGLLLSRFNPQVGDTVRVYHDSEFVLYMQVGERRWELTNGSSPELVCVMVPDLYWNSKPLSEFIKMMNDRGFR